MGILGLLFPFIVLGVLAYLVQILPMVPVAKMACYAILVLFAVALLFRALGIPTGFP